MQHVRNIRGSWALAALVSLLLSFAACSSDSPSEPRRDPPPPPGSNPPAAAFNITVTADPPQIEVASDDRSQIRVVIRRRDNGAPPPNGTTAVVTTSLGLFAETGTDQAVVTLTGGQAFLTLLPGDFPGTATVRATLEGSAGARNVRILEEGDFFIDFLEPNVGSPQGGDEVLINGRGFERPVRVTFAGQPAQVLSAGLNRIRVLTPPFSGALPASVDVSVTIALNTADQRSDTLIGGFTYTPAGGDPREPTVISVNPDSGPNSGGTVVNINGEGFVAPVRVLFGTGTEANFTGIEATVQSVQENRIVVVAPPASGLGLDFRNQRVSILVRNQGTGFATVAPNAFQYGQPVPDLDIRGISPLEGPATGGTDVTVFGSGFVEPLQVTINGVEQQVLSVTPDQLVFRTAAINVSQCPADGIVQAAPVEVRLLSPDGPPVQSDQNFRFVVEIPQLLSLDPDAGGQAGNTQVTLSGSGFVDPVQVRFSANGETFVADVTSVSGTSVVVRTPQVTNAAMDVAPCDDNNDGTVGEEFVPTAFSVTLENLSTGCVSNVLDNAFVFNPTNTQCRGDVGTPPECDDGIDNDMDGDIDFPDDAGCLSPDDDNEAG